VALDYNTLKLGQIIKEVSDW